MTSISPALSSTSPCSPSFRVRNFNAGPAGLPLEVLDRAQQELLNYAQTGMGVMEMSHRSPPFEAIIAQAEQRLRELLSIPASYAVLFMQGGATLQFSAVPLNLLGGGSAAAYLVTGAWSQAAAEEAKRFVPTVHLLGDCAPAFTSFPPSSSYAVPPDCAYLHYCHNETVHGVEAPGLPSTSVPLVVDCSSSFLSQPIDVGAHLLLYAGAQKNIGPAGVTVVIVRREALKATPHPLTPLMLQYGLLASKQSMYNTPPTFPIYVVALVLDWIQRQGGVEEMERRSGEKSRLLYACLDDSGGFYQGRVERGSRSRMNCVFTCRERGVEGRLVAEAEAAGFVGVAGHRSVGGLRVSLYNAVQLDDVRALVAFLQRFAQQNREAKK